MTDSTSPRSWHVDAETLRTWVAGVAGPSVSMSVEQHLMRCAVCRASAEPLVPVEPLTSIWDDVLSAIEAPQRSRSERLMVRLGVAPSDARLITSTVALRAAWIAGSIAVLFFTVLAALFAHDGGLSLFLAAAPLIPVVGVAVAYGPSSDPAYEAVLASPYPMVRLMLLRTSFVLVTTVPIVVLAGLLLPTSAVVAVAWLLPAAGFVAVVLTASSWVDPVHAAIAVAVGWVTAVAWAVRSGDPLMLFVPQAVIAYLALAAVAALIFIHRLHSKSPSWRLR
jgi:hypothetical protein